MHGEQGFKAVHKTVHLVKFFRPRLPKFCFRVLILRHLVLRDIKYCVYGTYLAAQQQNKLLQFPVCANVGVLFSLEIPPQAREKQMQTLFSL